MKLVGSPTWLLGFLILGFQSTAVNGELRRLRTDGPLPPLHPAQQMSLGALSRTTDEVRQATDSLMKFLEAAPPTFEEYLPACLAHVKQVITRVDRHYTDAQLGTVLENECLLDKEFISVESGFNQHEVCLEFAKKLHDARMKELDTGSTAGYNAFCRDYYVHKGGKIADTSSEAKAEEEAKAAKAKAEAEAKAEEKAAAEAKAKAEAEAKAKEEAATEEKAKEKAAEEKAAEEKATEEKSAEEAKEAAAKSEGEHKAEGKAEEKASEGQEEKKGEEKAEDKPEEKSGHGEEDPPKKVHKKGKFPMWAAVLVVGGIIAFVAAGLFLQFRNKPSAA